MKVCSKCKIEKSKDCFSVRNASNDGFRPNCKECQKKYDKNYRLKNRDKLIEYDNKRSKTPKRIAQHRKAVKIYDFKHKEQIAEHKRERRTKDPTFRISISLRSRLRTALKHNQKTGSAVRDLGCSVKYLKLFLENKFYINTKNKEIMTWENYGLRGWHIDHIRPLSKFDLTKREQLLEACHYTNLQPLWVEDHKEKTRKEIWKK